MKLTTRIFFLTLFSCACSSFANAQTASLNSVETCINSNAADVENAIDNLANATDFLLDYVCANEIAILGVERRSAVEEARAREQARMCQSIDEDSSEAWMCRKNTGFSESAVIDFAGAFNEYISAPAQIKSYAAKKMLQLRLKRQNK